MAKFSRPRRTFLGTLISLLAGAFFLGKFLRPATGEKKAILTVAKGDVPSHGALVYQESRVAVIRDGESFYALDLACTHLGCTVRVTPAGLVCPCHGSSFDRRGNVLKGPADRPLARHGLEEQGGYLVVTV